MNQYEEAAKAYVQALHLTPSAKYDVTPIAFDFYYHPSIYPLTPSFLLLPPNTLVPFYLTPPSFRHIWGYLRVVFTSMDRLDLSELSSLENTQSLADKLGIQLIHPH